MMFSNDGEIVLDDQHFRVISPSLLSLKGGLMVRVREGSGLPESLGAMKVPDLMEDACLLSLSLLSRGVPRFPK